MTNHRTKSHKSTILIIAALVFYILGFISALLGNLFHALYFYHSISSTTISIVPSIVIGCLFAWIIWRRYGIVFHAHKHRSLVPSSAVVRIIYISIYVVIFRTLFLFVQGVALPNQSGNFFTLSNFSNIYLALYSYFYLFSIILRAITLIFCLIAYIEIKRHEKINPTKITHKGYMPNDPTAPPVIKDVNEPLVSSQQVNNTKPTAQTSITSSADSEAVLKEMMNNAQKDSDINQSDLSADHSSGANVNKFK